MKTVIRLAAASACALMLMAGPGRAAEFTLDDALGLAYETNPQLAAAQAQLRGTDEEVAKANANWRPTINAGGTYGYQAFSFAPISPNPITGIGTLSSLSEHPLQGQLTVTQPIFRGGRTVAEISRAKALVRAGRAQLVATEQTVLLGAVTAYMNVARDLAIADLRRHDVEVLQKERDATQIQFTAGALTRTDVAQSEARLAGARADLTTAEGQLATSRADFVQSIGRPAEAVQSNPPLPRLPSTSEDVLTLALMQNPALTQAQANERAANYAVDDAWGALGPEFSIQGQYQYSQGSLANGYSTGIGSSSSVTHATAVIGQVNVPIYQGGAEEAAVREAREQHAQSQLNVTVADRQVRDAVEAAWAAFQSALGSIASNLATQKADEIAFEGVSKEQQVGGRTILDVLNAQQELLNAQVAVVTSQRDAVVAAYQVLASGGVLTAKALDLKVKLYDPLVHYDDDAGRWIGFGDFP